MLIEIENTSSPGASFTNNTNEVLLITYEWICEHKGITIPFRDFRMRLQSEKGINDNNLKKKLVAIKKLKRIGSVSGFLFY